MFIKVSFILLLFFIALFLNLNIGELGDIFSNFNEVFEYRLPRTLGIALIGAFLAVGGLIYQAIFRNPLVSPDLLGSSAGASLGVVLCIILGLGSYFIMIGAFIFALLTTILALFIAKVVGNLNNLVLILVGILLSTLLVAILNLVNYLIPDKSSMIGVYFFLMGSFNALDFDALMILTLGLIAIIPIFLISSRLDLLAAPKEVLITQGFKVNEFIALALILGTILSSITVVVAGIIGWVSLVIPNIIRLLFKVKHKYLILLSGILGSSFLLLADTLSKNISYVELPIGVITGLIGSPVFIAIMYLFLHSRNK